MIRKKDQHKSLAAPENEAKTALERTLVKKKIKNPVFYMTCISVFRCNTSKSEKN